MSLRGVLNQITGELDIQKHPALLEELRAKNRHAIEIVELADPDEDFNCVMFALDLIGSIVPTCSPLGRYYMNTEFMQHLIYKSYVTPISSPEVGALVVYTRDEKISHVGVVQENGQVRSKWGVGHLYDHDVWEVPVSFGSDIRYFRGMDPDHAFEVFRAFHER